MQHDNSTLEDNIQIQRSLLTEALTKPMNIIAKKCSKLLNQQDKLDRRLKKHFKRIPYCTNLYLMDNNGVQISSNISRNEQHASYVGFDRSDRPYLKGADTPFNFFLSSAYISINESRPSITALHSIKQDNIVIAIIGVDIALEDLPVSIPIYAEPQQWRQIKGDPSIRKTVFLQTRSESIWDQHSHIANNILKELIINKGVFQAIIHFSSSQGTIWFAQEPCEYRVLEAKSWTLIDTCLAYPSLQYPEHAKIDSASLDRILEKFQKLRLADDTLYLRSASINIFNGLISLTFSCDGTHYLPYDVFLEKDDSFWGCE